MFLGCLVLHARSYGPVHTLSPFAVCGALFYVFSQISHVNDASFPRRNDKPRWAHAQAESARGDYSQNSYAWGVFSIGLNNQTMHHLFPTVHYCHYPSLQKLLHPVFKIHKLPTPTPQTFAESVRSHFAFLRKLNDKPVA
jgi:fatty acid desaturase